MGGSGQTLSPLSARCFRCSCSPLQVPLTSGFIAKFAVFSAAAGSGAGILVVIGVLSSAIAAYFYIRIIIAMFSPIPADPPHIVRPSILTTAGIAACTVVTILLGILPSPSTSPNAPPSSTEYRSCVLLDLDTTYVDARTPTCQCQVLHQWTGLSRPLLLTALGDIYDY